MERQKKRAVILYALAAALLAFYAFVLVTGLHYSGDSEAYRYYYLDKSVDRYIPDRMLQEEYTANREIPFEMEDGTGNTGNGWSGTQDNGRRMTGVRAEFYICCTDAPQGSYELVIRRINEAGGVELAFILFIYLFSFIFFEFSLSEIISMNIIEYSLI